MALVQNPHTVIRPAKRTRPPPNKAENLLDFENENVAKTMRHVVYIMDSSSISCIGSSQVVLSVQSSAYRYLAQYVLSKGRGRTLQGCVEGSRAQSNDDVSEICD